jgi:hypothetical protein
MRGEAFRSITAHARMLPSFLIIGAQKCGTSSLFRYLMDHPQTAPPLQKEIHFFDLSWDKGMRWYRGCFPLAVPFAGRRITGESSPYYLFHPAVPERVAASLPRVRLIVLLRNPVDRAFSHYQAAVRRGTETRSFEHAVEIELERIGEERGRIPEGGDSSFHQRHTYVSRGYYLEQLERWAALYPRDQMMVIRSEAMFSNPVETWCELMRFLDLDATFTPLFRPYNQHGYAGSMAAGTRARLGELYAAANRDLEEWLGARLGW